MSVKRTISQLPVADALKAVDEKDFYTLSMKIDSKTGAPKEYSGTIFMNNSFKANGQKYDGWFTTTQDIVLTRGVADPTDKADKRNAYEGTRAKLESSKANSGDFGQFIDKLNVHYHAEVQRLIAEGKLVLGSSRKVMPLMRYNLSEDNKDDPNGVIEDPLIYFKVPKGNFPATFPAEFLRGQPKFVVYDATKFTINPRTGKPIYEQATITNSSGDVVPVNIDNMHEFIKFGSILKAGSRLYMPSVARSKSYVSMPIEVVHAIIAPRPEVTGFDDEDFGDDSAAAAESATAEQAADATAAVPSSELEQQMNAAAAAPPVAESTEAVAEVDALTNALSQLGANTLQM